MDLLVWTHTTLIAIEAKLSDWGQALTQAYLHRWCVDYKYVAMPAKAVTEKRLTEARRFGIGVIAVGSTGADIRQKAARNRPAKQIRQRLTGEGCHANGSSNVDKRQARPATSKPSRTMRLSRRQ